MEQIIADVKAERAAQDAQWGGPEHDDEHSPDDFMGFITRQVVKGAGDGSDVRDRFIKIAALAVAAIESLDRQMSDYGSNDG